MKEIDLDPIKAQIEGIETEMKLPMPTPPIGTLVVWYKKADIKLMSQIAGIVTKIEGPGKLSIITFSPNQMAKHVMGSLHVTHPIHDNRHNAVSQNSGAWDYPDGIAIPKAHRDLHLESLQKKRDSLVAQLDNATEIKAKNKSDKQTA